MKTIAYGFFWIFLNLLSILPTRVLYFLSDILFILLYHVVGYRKKVVYKNISESFPEKTDKEIKHIIRKFYRHLADVFLEYIILMRISFKNMNKRMQYKNVELVNELFQKKKDVVMVLGHYGNWEWPGSFASYTPYGLCSVYKELHNPYFDRFFRKLRGRFGNQLIEMKDSFKAVYSRKRNNQPTALALIADQTPRWKEMKFFTNFLNHPGTPIYLGPERIAKALDMAVVFGYITKPKRGHYVLEFILSFEEVKDLPEYAITEGHVQMLEKNIRQQPELWLWSHKRWKRMESDIYKEENRHKVKPILRNKQ